MGKRWNHGFGAGDHVSTDYVVDVCEKWIKSGEVENPEGKRAYLETIGTCGHKTLVFYPKGSGWGASPMNPNSWSTTAGQPIWQKKVMHGTKKTRK